MPSYSSVKGYQVLEIMFVSQEPAKGHSLLVPLRVVPVSAPALIVLYSELSLCVHSSLRTRSAQEEGEVLPLSLWRECSGVEF